MKSGVCETISQGNHENVIFTLEEKYCQIKI